MSDETSAPAGSEAIAASAPADTSELSISQARDLLFSQIEQSDSPAESAEAEQPATAETKSSQEDGAPETDPAEDAPVVEPAENQPPIDPPRSWTQAEKERFQSLPRETQEYLSHREQERETALRRSQNEVADLRKAAETERKAAEEVRQRYEAKLPALEKKLQTVGPFADIQSMDDLKNLQRNDPFRFQEYQLYHWEQQTEQAELQQAEARKVQERQGKRATYEAEQNKLLVEMVPEMGDAKKANELRTRAVAMLTDDLGLKNDQLSRWMQDDTGHEILSNAGIQKLIADGLKYRDIKSAPKAVVKTDLPPVQRPGVARPNGSLDSNIQALEAKLSQTGSLKDAKALLDAQLRASQRRAS